MTVARLLPQAEEEMTEAARFYEAAAGLGDEFLDEVARVIDRVQEAPELGAPLVYLVDADEGIIIAAVAHQSRRPGYWRNRPT